MKSKPDLKIMTPGGIRTLREIYEGHERTHVEQAALSFEEKIRILTDLQRLASSWGKKTDVIVWKLT